VVVLQQTPIEEICAPPSLIICPPEYALVCSILVTLPVVTLGNDAFLHDATESIETRRKILKRGILVEEIILSIFKI
jgi:hypothetical protein